MTTVLLDDRTAIRVAGPDAEHLLQNIVTTDLDALPQGVAKAGALLTPQGKIQFDFLISREGPDGFILDSRSSVADDLVRRLMLYHPIRWPAVGMLLQNGVAQPGGDE